MDDLDMPTIVDDAGRDENQYVSVDRLAMSIGFLTDLMKEDDRIGTMTVSDLLGKLADV